MIHQRYILPWLRVFIFGAIYLILTQIFSLSLEKIAPYWPVLFIVGNLFTIGLLDLFLRKDQRSYGQLIKNIMRESLTLKDFLFTLLWMVGIGVGGMIIISILIFQGPPPNLIFQPTWWLGIIYILFFPITAALSEIPFYYGVVYQQWHEKTKKIGLPMIYILMTYGLQHALLPFVFDVKFLVFRTISFIPLMVLITINYQRTKRLKPLVIAHGIMDLFTVIQMFI